MNRTGEAKRPNQRLALYLGLAFAIAWIAWIGGWALSRSSAAASWIEPLVIAGSFGPFAAAGLCVWLSDGPAGAARFYARAAQWRMGWTVLLISIFLLPMLAIVTAALFERGDPAFQIGWSDLPMVYIWLFVLGGPIAEEFGWSYLSDMLDTRLARAASTLLLGLIWAAWHLPLFFLDVPGLSQRFIPISAFFAMAVAMRFLFSWGYHRARRSILSNLLMHNGLNLSLTIVAIVDPAGGSQPRLWCLSGLTILCALFLWRALPPRQPIQ